MRNLFDEEILDEDYEERDLLRRKYTFRIVTQYGSSYESEGSRAFDPSELDVEDLRSRWMRG